MNWKEYWAKVNLTYSLSTSHHVPGITKQHLEEPQYLQFPAQLAKFRGGQFSDRCYVTNLIDDFVTVSVPFPDLLFA